MVNRTNLAQVKIWNKNVGIIAWNEDKEYSFFEYEPSFIKLGLNLSPIHMDIKKQPPFSFRTLNKETYFGLPGLFADSLPDKFGNSIINQWLATQGRDPNSFSPIERLCYIGKRGMGALEFFPAINKNLDQSIDLKINDLVNLAQKNFSVKSTFNTEFGKTDKEKKDALTDILRIGTSAGGARPKAIIAINDDNKIISGQTDVPKGFKHWLLKFDGVNDYELGLPKNYGRIEYAYYLMAKDAGIYMTECRLLEENGRAHFLTKRFDRNENKKIHMLSLCGLAHFDYNQAGVYGYENAFSIMRRLKLPQLDAEQQYRRMVFNVIARNQDDHTKNIAFIIDKKGTWRLSPAFDVTYSHNPGGLWTNKHQMTIRGKRDNFTIEDLLKVGESIRISKPKKIISEIIEIVSQWSKYAKKVGITNQRISEIQSYLRLKLPQN